MSVGQSPPVFPCRASDQLWVFDYTSSSTWQGWLYVAFATDVVARQIVG